MYRLKISRAEQYDKIELKTKSVDALYELMDEILKTEGAESLVLEVSIVPEENSNDVD